MSKKSGAAWLHRATDKESRRVRAVLSGAAFSCMVVSANEIVCRGGKRRRKEEEEIRRCWGKKGGDARTEIRRRTHAGESFTKEEEEKS